MKHKNLILFIMITFLRSAFLAMLKFFLRWYLKDVNITLEEITGYISLWWMFAYLLWSSIAYMFRKRNIVIFAWLFTIGCLFIGHMLGYYPFRVFVLLASGIGFVYSLRLIVKSIILSTEIQKSNYGETSVNGIVNIAILSGVLLWSYLGFTVFGRRGGDWFLVIVALLALSSILTMMMNYDMYFETKPFLQTIKQSLPNIGIIIRKYIRLLLPIGVLRAISTAIGQKMLELGVDLFQRTPKSSIIIIIIWFVGAIVGHMISMFFKRRKRIIAMVFTIIFWLSTIYFPHIIDKYEYYITLNIFWFFVGIFFGIAVNLVEWRYFFHIGDDHRKEYGSAAYGIMSSIIIFVIMLAADYLSKKVGMKISFFFFGMVLLLMPFFLKKFDAPEIQTRILKKKG